MNDAYQAHSFFALSFTCEACIRAMSFSSTYPDFTNEWYLAQARQAQRERWYLPPPDKKELVDPWSAWCADCALKLGFASAETTTSDTAASV